MFGLCLTYPNNSLQPVSQEPWRTGGCTLPCASTPLGEPESQHRFFWDRTRWKPSTIDGSLGKWLKLRKPPLEDSNFRKQWNRKKQQYLFLFRNFNAELWGNWDRTNSTTVKTTLVTVSNIQNNLYRTIHLFRYKRSICSIKCYITYWNTLFRNKIIASVRICFWK